MKSSKNTKQILVGNAYETKAKQTKYKKLQTQALNNWSQEHIKSISHNHKNQYLCEEMPTPSPWIWKTMIKKEKITKTLKPGDWKKKITYRKGHVELKEFFSSLWCLISTLPYSLRTGLGLGLGFKRFMYYYLLAEFPLGLCNVKKTNKYINLKIMYKIVGLSKPFPSLWCLIFALPYSLHTDLGLGFKRFIYYYLVAKFPLGLHNVKKSNK